MAPYKPPFVIYFTLGGTMVAKPPALVSDARQLKEEAQALYEQFKHERNRPRMAHMRLIFDAAEKVRYELEVDPKSRAPAPPWKVVLEIMHLGVNENDSAEDEVYPLICKLKKLESDYDAYRRGDA